LSALMRLLYLEKDAFWDLHVSREKSSPKFKVAKNRFILLLGGNTEGDYKLKPVMVYHCANPDALKGYVKHLIPVPVYSNAKGWVTDPLFIEYLE
jgi:hypothetical protein